MSQITPVAAVAEAIGRNRGGLTLDDEQRSPEARASEFLAALLLHSAWFRRRVCCRGQIVGDPRSDEPFADEFSRANFPL